MRMELLKVTNTKESGVESKEISFIVEGKDKSEQSDAQTQYTRNITYSEGAKRKTKWSLCTKV